MPPRKYWIQRYYHTSFLEKCNENEGVSKKVVPWMVRYMEESVMRVYIWGEAARFQNYQRAIIASGGEVQFGGSIEGCDALLLPGGGDVEPWRYGQKNIASYHFEPERDAAELELLNQFTTLRKPVLGICRGIQTINVFFGGTLVQDICGHDASGWIDRYHTVRTVPSLLRNVCGDKTIVNSAHHQAIDRLGMGLEVVQWTADGTIEAVRHKVWPLWGLQWHPERMLDYDKTSNILFENFVNN